MIGSTISAAKSSLLLIGIGIAMVVTMIILAASFLGGSDPNTIPSGPQYPTPTPEIQYQPIPE